MAWNEAASPRGMQTRTSGFGRNYAKTAMLMAFLIALLAIGGNAWGGYQGMLLFGSIGLVINFFMYWFSDRIALMAHRAQPVTREQAPELYEIVERLTRIRTASWTTPGRSSSSDRSCRKWRGRSFRWRTSG